MSDGKNEEKKKVQKRSDSPGGVSYVLRMKHSFPLLLLLGLTAAVARLGVRHSDV